MNMFNVTNIYILHYYNIMKYNDTVKNRNQETFLGMLPKMFQKVCSNKFARNLLFKLAIFMEPFISILIVTILLIPFITLSIIIRKKELSGKLYLSYALLLKKRVETAGLYNSSTDWLYPIFLPTGMEKVTDKNIHNIFEYINILDVIKAYFYSLYTIVASVKYLKFKYLFRNYVSFEFYLTALYLQKIPRETEIIFANQIDRWAVLFDRAPQKRKVLFQHGIEMPEANWPTKLNNIKCVYALSEKESERLINATLSNRPEEINILPPTIKLTPFDIEQKNSLLIVSYPLYGLYENESKLIKGIDSNKCHIFLKLHPGHQDISRYLDLQKEYNYTLITNNVFPDVDNVVSYRSTLAVEYEVYNKKILYYREYTVEQIIEYINNL